MKNLFLIILLSIFSYSILFATAVKRLSLEETVNNSSLIVEAKCTDVKEESREDDRGLTYVYYTLQILEIISGKYEGKSVELSRLKSPKLVGVKFEKDDEGILFLTKTKDGKHWVVVGMSQGFYKYEIENSKRFVNIDDKKQEREILVKKIKEILENEKDK